MYQRVGGQICGASVPVQWALRRACCSPTASRPMVSNISCSPALRSGAQSRRRPEYVFGGVWQVEGPVRVRWALGAVFTARLSRTAASLLVGCVAPWCPLVICEPHVASLYSAAGCIRSHALDWSPQRAVPVAERGARLTQPLQTSAFVPVITSVQVAVKSRILHIVFGSTCSRSRPGFAVQILASSPTLAPMQVRFCSAAAALQLECTTDVCSRGKHVPAGLPANPV
jgi:hypothetical protein